jgi:hypothetical protein
MRRSILACIAIVASTAGASAQTGPNQASPAQPSALQARNPAYSINTFRDLVNLCSKDRSDPEYVGAIGLCAGYISGVMDYHLVDTGWAGGRKGRRVCLPEERPTRMEALQGLVSWDRSNQKYDDEPAAVGVMRYYMASYPCQGSRSAKRTSRPNG